MAPSCAAYDVTGLADRNQADDTFRFLPCVKIVVTVRQTRKQKAPYGQRKVALAPLLERVVVRLCMSLVRQCPAP